MSRPFKPMKDLDMGKVIANIVDGLSSATEMKGCPEGSQAGLVVQLNPEKVF